MLSQPAGRRVVAGGQQHGAVGVAGRDQQALIGHLGLVVHGTGIIDIPRVVGSGQLQELSGLVGAASSAWRLAWMSETTPRRVTSGGPLGPDGASLGLALLVGRVVDREVHGGAVEHDAEDRGARVGQLLLGRQQVAPPDALEVDDEDAGAVELGPRLERQIGQE